MVSLTALAAFSAVALGMVLHEFPEGILTYTLLVRAGFDSIENLTDKRRLQLVVFIEMGIGDKIFCADRISFAHLVLRFGTLSA